MEIKTPGKLPNIVINPPHSFVNIEGDEAVNTAVKMLKQQIGAKPHKRASDAQTEFTIEVQALQEGGMGEINRRVNSFTGKTSRTLDALEEGWLGKTLDKLFG